MLVQLYVCVCRTLGIPMYTHIHEAYNNNQWQKEAMHLKKSKEVDMGGAWKEERERGSDVTYERIKTSA